MLLDIGTTIEALSEYTVRTMGESTSYSSTIDIQEGDLVKYMGIDRRESLQQPLHKFIYFPVDDDGEPTGEQKVFHVHRIHSFLRGIGYDVTDMNPSGRKELSEEESKHFDRAYRTVRDYIHNHYLDSYSPNLPDVFEGFEDFCIVKLEEDPEYWATTDSMMNKLWDMFLTEKHSPRNNPKYLSSLDMTLPDSLSRVQDKIIEYFKILRPENISRVTVARIMADLGINLPTAQIVLEDKMGYEIFYEPGGDSRGFVRMSHGKGEPGDSGVFMKNPQNNPKSLKRRMFEPVSILEMQEFDMLVDELDDPNLRGFARRIPTSKHYRKPPVGSPSDIPPNTEIRRTFEAAKMVKATRKNNNPGRWCLQYMDTAKTLEQAKEMFDGLVLQNGYLGGRIIPPSPSKPGYRIQTFFEDEPKTEDSLLPEGVRRVIVPEGMARQLGM